MARNPDGTFQQGDPETRQAAQKGGQASHGSQRQNQAPKKTDQDLDENRQQGGMGQNRQQSQNQPNKQQWGSGGAPKTDGDLTDNTLNKNKINPSKGY